MDILITGAYGNIGRAVIEEAISRGHGITVFEKKNRRTTKLARKYSKKVKKTIFGDITDYDDIRGAVEGMDAVIHLAAVIPPSSNNRKLCFKVNVDGTANLARAIRESGDRAVLVHSSSCSVMGPTQHMEPPVNENMEPVPTDNYTESKIMSEQAIGDEGVGRYCVTRLGAVMPSKGIWNLKTLVYGFEIAFDSRIEIVLDSDVGLAQVTAAEKLRLGLIESKSIYFLGGGGACRMKYGDFFNGLLETLGVPPLRSTHFTSKESFLDWLDTDKSQRDLSFQRHTYADYKRIFKSNMKKFIPFTKLFGKIVYRFISMKSPYAGQGEAG